MYDGSCTCVHNVWNISSNWTDGLASRIADGLTVDMNCES